MLIRRQAGHVDADLHLGGAYSMAASLGVLAGTDDHGLPEAGFWNYLREDITFGLYEHCPLRMDLGPGLPAWVSQAEQNSLNAITLLLGRVINDLFHDSEQDESIVKNQWFEHLQTLQQWVKASQRVVCRFREQNKRTGRGRFPPCGSCGLVTVRKLVSPLSNG
jgi:hypothetical protein